MYYVLELELKRNERIKRNNNARIKHITVATNQINQEINKWKRRYPTLSNTRTKHTSVAANQINREINKWKKTSYT